jgi:PAS domain S-box-containing protein
MGVRSGVAEQQSKTARVLYVDDQVAGTDAAIATVAADDEFEIEEVDHAAAAIDTLETDSYDCVVSGYDLTQVDGLTFLEEVRERWPDLPFVLYTDSGSERVASDAFSAGATDYVEKDRAHDDPAVLLDALRHTVNGTAAGDGSHDDRDGRLEPDAADLGVLFERHPDPAIRLEYVDGDAVVRAVNPAFEETFGLTDDALAGRSAGVLQVPTGAADDPDADAAAATDRVDTTVTRVTTDGSRRFRFRTIPFTAADGTPGVYGVYTEPAEPADAEVETGLDRTRVDEALERTETGVWTWDPESDRLSRHASVNRLFGIDEGTTEGALDEFLGRVHPVDRETVADAFERAVTEERFDAEFRVQTADGTRRWISGSGETVTADDSTLLVGVFVDVTERKRREEELTQYRRIVETSNDPVYVLDRAGRFEFVDDAFVAATGYERDEIVGEHVSELLDDEDVLEGEEVIRALLTSDVDRGVLECEVETNYGTSRWCEIDIALLDGDEGIDGTVGIVRDVTERMERERELERQTERLEEFASVVAHDLRNPLTVAIGHTEVLQDEYDDEFLDRVAEAHERMEQLIDDLLALAREGRAVDETEPVDIERVARDAWGTVATGDADLVVDAEATVLADADRLRTLFENLVKNAVEHGSTSPDSQARQDAGGADSAEPSVADAPEDAVEHGSTSNQNAGHSGDAVEHGGADVTVTVADLPEESGFAVADDGAGIPEGEREAVFDRGYSTDDDGTGFGLAIVEGIAEAHGWTVTVEESGAGGARFAVTGVEVVE